VVEADEDAGEEEERRGELDEREALQIACVDDVGDDAEKGEEEGEAVDEIEEGVEAGYGVDEVVEESAGEDCVFFDELGEVVEARSCGGMLVSCW
jgi:hypothetical protein